MNKKIYYTQKNEFVQHKNYELKKTLYRQNYSEKTTKLLKDQETNHSKKTKLS
jgi:hypothetical protein